MKSFLGKCFATLALALILGAASSAFAQWETIQTGFEYQKFTLPGPVEAFVMRMARVAGQESTRAVDSMIASGQFYKTGLDYQGRKPVSQMVSFYNDAMNYYYQTWGQRNDIVCAINGDYWEREYYPSGPYTGRPQGGQVQSGWFCRRFPFYGGGSGIFYTIWGGAGLGGDVVNGDNNAARQIAYFANDTELDITGLNVERGSNALILYTPQWGPRTYTDNSGIEVLVRVNRPALPLPAGVSSFSCEGPILEIRDGAGNTPILFDQVVLSATGSAATALRSRCVTGQTIKFRMSIRDYGFDDRTPVHPPQDWTKAYGSIGVDREVVTGGQKTSNIPSPDLPDDPRTAVAFNANYFYFIVVDGRSSYSIGMNMNDLAEFCINYLQADCAASLDGGGSSAMWVKGRGIVNRPSDGAERYTVNGLMMVAIQPKQQTTTLDGATFARTTAAATLYSRPGSSHPVVGTVAADQIVNLLDHSMNGLRATNSNWWQVSTPGSLTGWIAEDKLENATAVVDWLYYQ